MAVELRSEITFASARVVHLVMPPHEPDGYTSVSEPLAICISFTGHEDAVVEDHAGRASEWSFPPGDSALNGSAPTHWLRVNEPAEAVEIRATAEELASIAQEIDVDWHARPESLPTGRDPVIWSMCARFRTAALGAETIEDLEADELVRTLLTHVAVRHLGARAPRLRGRLDRRRLTRVADFIEDTLANPPSLREMADVAAMSPFHFQRLFRATTGLSPHAYVMAKRLECARRMLATSGSRVADVAAQLGFTDLAHFRRSFRRQFNASPRGSRA